MDTAVDEVGPEYLEATATFVARAKRLSYRRMCPRLGGILLDVGCGPGIDTVELIKYVGQTGHVTGVDHNAAMVSAANQRAELAGVSGRVTHRCGDAAALPFPDDTFDAVRSERLLLHLTDPAGAISDMVRVTRPGGRVVVLDTDFGSHSIDAFDLKTAKALVQTLAETSLKNGYSGRRLLGLMKHECLTRSSLTVLPLCFTRYEHWRSTVRMDAVERDAIRTGAVSKAELNRWRKEMRSRADSGTFFASLTMVLVSSVKQSR